MYIYLWHPGTKVKTIYQSSRVMYIYNFLMFWIVQIILIHHKLVTITLIGEYLHVRHGGATVCVEA